MRIEKEKMVEAGERLRSLRGIRTRIGVARAVGISCSALYFYETGERNPSGRVKEKLASYYNVGVGDIFYLPEDTTKSSKKENSRCKNGKRSERTFADVQDSKNRKAVRKSARSI